MKILFRIAAVLLILTILAVVIIGFSLNSIAKTAVEEGGTFAMGVDTHVEGVNVGFISGKFGVDNLRIANPEGFEAPEFFSLKTAKLEVDMGSVSGDTIVIPEILIDGITLDIEQNSNGSNYATILDNLKRFESEDSGGESTPSDTPPDSGEPKPPGQDQKFVVRKISMSNIVANVKVDVLGKQSEFSVPVPAFAMENLGNSDDSQSIADILSTIMQGLLDSVAENGAGILPDGMLDDIKGQLDGLRDSVDTLAEDLGSGLQGVIDGTTDTDDLKESAKETVDKAKEGLKGLFDKD